MQSRKCWPQKMGFFPKFAQPCTVIAVEEPAWQPKMQTQLDLRQFPPCQLRALQKGKTSPPSKQSPGFPKPAGNDSSHKYRLEFSSRYEEALKNKSLNEGLVGEFLGGLRCSAGPVLVLSCFQSTGMPVEPQLWDFHVQSLFLGLQNRCPIAAALARVVQVIRQVIRQALSR